MRRRRSPGLSGIPGQLRYLNMRHKDMKDSKCILKWLLASSIEPVNRFWLAAEYRFGRLQLVDVCTILGFFSVVDILFEFLIVADASGCCQAVATCYTIDAFRA